MSRRRKRIVRVVIAGVALAAAIVWGQFRYSSICTTCGRMQHTRQWQMPFTEITCWTTRSETRTPLNAVVDGAHLAVPSDHAHRWLFASGGGNGIVCAIGDGRHLLTAVLSREVAAFVDATARFRGREVAQSWLDALLDPNRSNHASSAIRGSDFPAAGLTDRAAFDRWWDDNKLMLGGPFEPP